VERFSIFSVIGMVSPSLAWRPGSGTARRLTPRPLGSSARRHQCGGRQMAFIDK